MTNMEATQGLIPLVIGVTGHRDIPTQDYVTLKAALTEQLVAHQNNYKNSPCILLSALAEGADRLAADVAFTLGWQVGVLLPLEVDDYETDFESIESVQEFRALLAQAAFSIVIDVSTLGKAADTLAPRDRAYQAVGLEILRRSQILVALWDGSAERKPGGTTDVVRMFLDGIPAHASESELVAVPDAGPVWHIRTPRKSRQDLIAAEEVGKCEVIWPSPAGLSTEGESDRWSKVFRRIDQYNEDARHAIANDARKKIPLSRSYLGLDTEPTAATTNSAAAMYAVADYMSQTTQEKRALFFKAMIVVAVFTIFFEQLYSGPFFEPYWMALVGISGVVAYLLYKRGKQLRMEERYLDYRALAEACRVQYYWKAAGLTECAAQVFLRGQRDELEWIRQAVMSTELMALKYMNDPALEAERMQYLSKAWLKDQQRYFVGIPNISGGNKAAFNDQQSARWATNATYLFIAGICMMAIITVTHFALQPLTEGLIYNLLQYMIVGYGMSFAAAGVVLAYAENKAYAEQSRRYRRIGLNMTMADKNLHNAIAANDMRYARSVVLAIGREALAENGDWLILHRDRPVKVPVG